jgi:hypothetical protein
VYLTHLPIGHATARVTQFAIMLSLLSLLLLLLLLPP